MLGFMNVTAGEKVMKTSGQILLPLSAAFLVGCAFTNKTTYSLKKDIVYRRIEGVALTLDLYRPKEALQAPMVMILHGGGWRARSGDLHRASEALARQGFIACAITYRLVPKSVYPAPLEDMKAAVEFMKFHAGEWGGNPNKIFLWGYSAGGHLALRYGLDPANGVQGIVAGAAPVDLPRSSGSSMIRGFMGQPASENPELWRDASPLSHIQKGSPPVFLYHGKDDRIVNPAETENLKNQLLAKGVKVEALIVSGGHITVYLWNRESIERGVEFLRKL